MCDSTSDLVYQSFLNGVHDCPLFDPDAELTPERTPLAQYFQVTPSDSFQPVLMHALQKSYPRSNSFYETDPRLVLDPSDSRITAGPVSDDSHVENITAVWGASAMDLSPFRYSAPNEPAVSYWSETHEGARATEHYPAFMTRTMSQIERLGIEVRRYKTHLTDHSQGLF